MMSGLAGRGLSALLLLAAVAGAQDFDVVIRNGRVVDGTGNPWRKADVGIRNGRIVAVGDLAGRRAGRLIDAAGLIVAPGFIDIHNHSDDTLVADGNAESMIRQGVTSMILGEGGSAAPLGGKQDKPPANADWTDFDGYFKRLLRQGISTNVGSYVGSSQIWTYVRGPKAGPPTREELQQMEALVRQAMQQGALGVSSSLSGPPGAWIDKDTLVAMCREAAKFGGIYSTHMRTEGQGVFEAVAEAIDIGRQAKIPVDIIHLKIADHRLWGKMPEVIATIRNARMNGQQVEAHVYPYRAGQNNLSSIVPPWAHEGGVDAMLKRLKDPQDSAKIRQQILNGIPGTDWYNHYTATGSWEGMLLASVSNPEYRKYQGKRMSEVIKAIGGDPIDVLFRLLEANRGSIPTIYFHHSEEDMRYALQQPFVSIGSDGTAMKAEGATTHPHPRYYGTFPRVLGRYVREEKVLSLEEAIRKMTSANAAKIGIYDRGLLRPGFHADVTIFDPQTIIDMSTWEDPHQYAKGVEYVLVNGRVVLDRGEHTRARPGQILYGGGKVVTAAETTQAAPVAPAVADQRAAAEWVLRSHGRLRLAGRDGVISSLSQLPEKDVHIRSIDLIGTTIDPSELKRLSGLTELTELLLPGPSFNPGAGSRLDANDELKALASLPKLEKLHFSLHFLSYINVQDKGLDLLKPLADTVTEMRLSQTRVKGPGLAEFRKLKKLDLNYSMFSDEGMQHLADKKDLQHLLLRDTLLTDKGIQHLAGLTNLEVLDLYGSRLTDEGMKYLAGMKKLQKLNLLGSTISDEGLASLAGLTELRELNLYRSTITNAGLAQLKGLKNLRSLDLRYTRVSRNGVEEFRRALPQVNIEFQDAAPQTSDAGLRQSKPAAQTEQAIADWVTRMGGTAAIRGGSVRAVDLSRTPVSDAQIAYLRALPALEQLDLRSTETGDLAMASLSGHKNLKQLDLSHTMVSDKGLAPLSSLTSLETLSLAHTLVEGSGLEAVAKLPKLQSLSLAGAQVRDDGIGHLAQSPALRQINLSYTDVGAAGVRHLSAIATLEDVDLTATDIGDPELQALAKLTGLRRLLISYGRYTDEGVQYLKPLAKLEQLEMARTRVTGKGLSVLSSFPELRVLNLDYTDIGDDDMGNIAAALPKIERLRLDTANLSDKGLAPLAGLKSLKDLNIYHTMVTEKGFEQLKSALPDTKIVFDPESSLPTRRKS